MNHDKVKYVAMVLYPYADGANFDFERYAQKLAPRYAEILGSNCIRFEVRKGTNSPGTSHPAFICIANFWVKSRQEFGKAMGDPRMADLMREISEFTAIKPIRQFDEVLIEESLSQGK
jgi:uncharacterized protein (TIGR02118 family)